MDEFTGMAFHSAEREVERLERQVDEARQEAAELRRQLAEAQAAIAAGQPGEGGIMKQSDHEKSINALRIQHAHDLEAQERKYEALLTDLRKQRDAAIRGVEIREEILTRKTAEFKARLQAEIDLRTLSTQDGEVDEFNAGYEACRAGQPIEAEPSELHFDVWRQGWMVADYERMSAEVADLRRQLEHANRWRDNEILAANEARADAADLRRQLAETQAEIAAVPRPEIGELCDLIGNSTTAISLDCPAGWAVREWLETYDAADLRRQFEQERVEIGMLRRQLQEGEQAALSHAIGQIFHLRRQLAECQEIAAARGESLGYETADEWNDNPATDANDARQEAAKLRRQLDRERIAAIQHAIWSHWMTYQFSVCLRNDDGTMTIPAQKVMRWERQAATPYAELSEAERESDRHQADRILVAAVTPHRAGKGDE